MHAYTKAMRLFPGSGDPDWSSVARSGMTNNTARDAYVDKYLCGIDPDHVDECVKGIDVPTDADVSDWPDLWRLQTPNPSDPTAANAAGRVDPKVLLAAGVKVRFVDPSGYDYPNRTKEIPWSPPVGGNNDASLQAIRNEGDYQYADIVVVTSFVSKFYEEHIHAAGDEVRYIIDGSGYFGE